MSFIQPPEPDYNTFEEVVDIRNIHSNQVVRVKTSGFHVTNGRIIETNMTVVANGEIFILTRRQNGEYRSSLVWHEVTRRR